MRASACLAVAGLGALLGTTGARAQVFEIGRDGTMVRAGRERAADADLQDFGSQDVTGDADEAGPPLPAAALTPVAEAVAPAAYRAALAAAAARYGVSPDLLAALVWQESRWQAAAVSPKGAIGLAQLMPATARTLAVDPRDDAANLMGAARYLRQLLDLFDGDVEKALAAYNAGPARVLRANGVPAIAETRSYVATIIARLSPAQGALK